MTHRFCLPYEFPFAYALETNRFCLTTLKDYDKKMTFNNNNTINKLEIWKTFKRIILRYNLYHHNTVARSSNLADMKKYPLHLRSLFQSSACHHTSSTTNRTTGCDSTTIQNWERWNILTFIKNVLLAALCKCRS